MVALATITLGSSASSVTFGSIPATYRDLRLVISFGSSTVGNTTVGVRANGDTASNYYNVYMLGNGSTTASGSENNTFLYGSYIGSGSTGSPYISTMDILDYMVVDKHKSMVARNNDASQVVTAYAGRWANTAAITSLTCVNFAGNYTVGSTFSLFGVLS